MTPAERVAKIEANAVGSDLNSWEKHSFLPSIKQRASLTEKQETVLKQIENKLFGDNDD
jgi:hypothetical protein